MARPGNIDYIIYYDGINIGYGGSPVYKKKTFMLVEDINKTMAIERMLRAIKKGKWFEKIKITKVEKVVTPLKTGLSSYKKLALPVKTEYDI
jgi:hypothetical protein